MDFYCHILPKWNEGLWNLIYHILGEVPHIPYRGLCFSGQMPCVFKHSMACTDSGTCLPGTCHEQNYEVNKPCLEYLFICFLNPISSFSSGRQQSPEATSYGQNPTLNPTAKPSRLAWCHPTYLDGILFLHFSQLCHSIKIDPPFCFCWAPTIEQPELLP